MAFSTLADSKIAKLFLDFHFVAKKCRILLVFILLWTTVYTVTLFRYDVRSTQLCIHGIHGTHGTHGTQFACVVKSIVWLAIFIIEIIWRDFEKSANKQNVKFQGRIATVPRIGKCSSANRWWLLKKNICYFYLFIFRLSKLLILGFVAKSE